MRRYLAEFLSDRRVVEIPAIAWQPILYGLILRTRPKRSAEAYRQVWTNAGSPLAVIARRQAQALQRLLGDRIRVDFAMRYGNPGIAGAIERMMAAGCTRILAAPLYPQYCAATTATANDAVFAALARCASSRRCAPCRPISTIRSTSTRSSKSARQLAALDFEPRAASAQLPRHAAADPDLGDPYHCHCLETARLLSAALGREVDVAFQSRFGRAQWLEPATDATLAAFPPMA